MIIRQWSTPPHQFKSYDVFDIKKDFEQLLMHGLDSEHDKTTLKNFKTVKHYHQLSTEYLEQVLHN